MPLFHHLPLRVLWSDADVAGIVWFGVFCRYFEHAEEDLFRHLGSERTQLLARLGVFMPRTSLQMRFRSPAKLGDEIAVGVGVSLITPRRIEFAFDVRERATDRLVCEASYRVACVDAATFAARAFPDEISNVLRAALVPSDALGAAHPARGDNQAARGAEYFGPATPENSASGSPEQPSSSDRRSESAKP